MPAFQTSPGMRDILPPESERWRAFEQAFAQIVERAGYGQLITPLLEDLGVFTRIGDATEIVTKEMYDFVDKGDRHVALRRARDLLQADQEPVPALALLDRAHGHGRVSRGELAR